MSEAGYLITNVNTLETIALKSTEFEGPLLFCVLQEIQRLKKVIYDSEKNGEEHIATGAKRLLKETEDLINTLQKITPKLSDPEQAEAGILFPLTSEEKIEASQIRKEEIKTRIAEIAKKAGGKLH